MWLMNAKSSPRTLVCFAVIDPTDGLITPFLLACVRVAASRLILLSHRACVLSSDDLVSLPSRAETGPGRTGCRPHFVRVSRSNSQFRPRRSARRTRPWLASRQVRFRILTSRGPVQQLSQRTPDRTGANTGLSPRTGDGAANARSRFRDLRGGHGHPPATAAGRVRGRRGCGQDRLPRRCRSVPAAVSSIPASPCRPSHGSSLRSFPRA